jgi:hypothetical protein
VCGIAGGGGSIRGVISWRRGGIERAEGSWLRVWLARLGALGGCRWIWFHVTLLELVLDWLMRLTVWTGKEGPCGLSRKVAVVVEGEIVLKCLGLHEEVKVKGES